MADETVSAARTDAAVRQLLDEGPLDQRSPLRGRELRAELVAAGALVVAAIIMVVALPRQRGTDAATAALLVGSYVIAARVQLSAGAGFSQPTQLVLVPMLFLVPARVVPLLVAAGLAGSALVEVAGKRKHPSRLVGAVAGAWYAVGPALVFVIADPGPPALSDTGIYVIALIAQFVFDYGAAAGREWSGRGVAPRLQLAVMGWIYLVDVMLTPPGGLSALASIEHRFAFLLNLPLIGLVWLLARERDARIFNALAAADARARALEIEAQATRERERLVALASHELQTPTSVIAGLTRLMSRGRLPPERRAEAEASLAREAGRLHHLVQQFLDYTRLAGGRRVVVRPERSDPAELVRHVADLFAGERLELDVPDDLPAALADPERIEQILHGLVRAAIAHSPAAEAVHLAVTAGADDVRISVTDRGEQDEGPDRPWRPAPGTPEGEIPADGTGVDLVVARLLAREQGGQLRVRRPTADETTFTLVLPRA